MIEALIIFTLILSIVFQLLFKKYYVTVVGSVFLATTVVLLMASGHTGGSENQMKLIPIVAGISLVTSIVSILLLLTLKSMIKWKK